jgi:hypothetical protein
VDVLNGGGFCINKAHKMAIGRQRPRCDRRRDRIGQWVTMTRSGSAPPPPWSGGRGG